MRVIVSTELKDNYKGFMVIDSFKRVLDLKNVDTLIIHKYKEEDFKVGTFISRFYKNGVQRFIYINSSPSFMLKTILNGVHGFYFEDEFYLKDEDELLALLDNLGVSNSENTSMVATSNIKIVNDFIEAFTRGEERIKAPLYLEQVNQAINQISEITFQQQVQIETMGSSALDIFAKASKIINQMSDQQKLIQQQLSLLESNQQDSSRPSFNNNTVYFPPYRYFGTAPLLLLRELSPCKYLTSFALGYTKHLHYDLNLRVKLIFVHQKAAGVSKKYDSFATIISTDTYQVKSLYSGEIIATNTPKKEVMKELLMSPVDVFVVVDRLYGSQGIITGKYIEVGAVSGLSDCRRFMVDPQDCIFSVVKPEKCLFCISSIKGFPTDPDARLAAYSQINSDKYEILDKKLNLSRG